MATLFQLCPSLPSICSSLVVSLLSLFFFAWIIKLFVRKNENKSKLVLPPEAGGAWPIIGHLHLLGGALLPHESLGEMADKHGPIFSIRLGVRKALVVSSWEMAKECLLLNDKVVASRPRLIVGDIMAYGDANISFTQNVPYWRCLRKIVALELQSNHRLSMLSCVWKEEANVCINKVHELWFESKRRGSDVVLVDLKQWFSQLSMSIIVRIIFGKNYVGCGEEMSHNLRKTVEDFMYRLGSFPIGEALPFLRWLDLGGQESAMKKSGKEMDAILETWLREHKEWRLSRSTKDGDNKDFMDAMLSTFDDSHAIKDYGFDADTINKATCLMMLAGASDTSSVFLTWAISLLLNNRGVLKKAQDELTNHVGKNRQVNESDIPNLPYLQAIVKETLRKYPPGPLGILREFSDDCTVGGYHVRKGTRLIVNLPKIQSDPRVWEDPMEFRPERFLTTHKDVDVRGKSFELIPFGSGIRICPGASFSLRSTHFVLATFLHAFELSTPGELLVDMTESSGLTNLKATPLDVLVAPRLSAELYE